MRDFLGSVLTDVHAAVDLHKKGLPAPFSISFLGKVQAELEKVAATLDPRIYRPSYPRAVLDWPDDSALADQLLSASYLYGKIRPGKEAKKKAASVRASGASSPVQCGSRYSGRKIP